MNDVSILLGAVVLVVTLVSLILRRRSRPGQITALVLLLKEPLRLADWQVRQAAARAFEMELTIGNVPGPHTILPLAAEKVQRNLPAGAGTTYLINTGRRKFLLNTFSQPYMEQPERFAERISDLRLRHAVASHRAWISADSFGKAPSSRERGEIYAALGRMLAPFAGDDCLALYCPELERCNEYSPDVIGGLTSGQPLRIFDKPTFAPVLNVDGDDPRLQAAAEEARRCWPDFVRAFQVRGNSDRPFIVKARFTDGDDVEFMWVSVNQIAEDKIIGRLENSPASLSRVKEGGTVMVPLSDLNDWICEINGDIAGGFTMKVIREMHRCQ